MATVDCLLLCFELSTGVTTTVVLGFYPKGSNFNSVSVHNSSLRTFNQCVIVILIILKLTFKYCSTMSVLPGICALLEEIDKKIMVELRDGRILIGYLRSIDQFANLVLHRTVERIHVDCRYGEIPLGVFIVRGDNVVLLGEVDENKDMQKKLVQVSKDEILEAQILEQKAKQEKERLRTKALKERGFSYQLDTTHEDF